MAKHRTIKFTCASGLCLAIVLSSGRAVEAISGVAAATVAPTPTVFIAQQGSSKANDSIALAVEKCNNPELKLPSIEICNLEIYDTSINNSASWLKTFIEDDYIPQLAAFKGSTAAPTPDLNSPDSIVIDTNRFNKASEHLANIKSTSESAVETLAQLQLRDRAQFETIDTLLKDIRQYATDIEDQFINPLKETDGAINKALIVKLQGSVKPVEADGVDIEATLAENEGKAGIVSGAYGEVTQRSVETLLERQTGFLVLESDRFDASLSDLRQELKSKGFNLIQASLLGLLFLLATGAAFVLPRYLSSKSELPKKKRNLEDDVRAILSRYFRQKPSEFEDSVVSIMKRQPASARSTQSSMQMSPTIDQEQVISRVIRSAELRQFIREEVTQALAKSSGVAQNPFERSGQNRAVPLQSGSPASSQQAGFSAPRATTQPVRYSQSPPQQSSVITLYNNGQLSRRQAKEVVSLTSASQESFRLATGELPTLIPDSSHGNYWILSEGSQDYLVPRAKARFNESSLQSLASLYDYAPSPNLERPIRIIEPAIVRVAGSEVWQLKTKGRLSFG